jgi:FkbM family methyltransferase
MMSAARRAMVTVDLEKRVAETTHGHYGHWMENDLIYDLGLHKGEDAAYYLAKGYRVIGFEANPRLAQHCRDRFAGEIEDGRMTVVEGVIAATDEATIRFYEHTAQTHWGTIDPDRAERNAGLGPSIAVELPVVSLRDWLEITGIPYYFKVDIEGADEHCLQTLLEFDDRPEYLSLESSQDWGELLDEFALLERLGYDRFAVVQQAGLDEGEIDTTTYDGAPMHYRFEEFSSGSFGEDIQRWTDRDGALARYRRVFWMYRLCGLRIVRHTRIGRGLRGRMQGWIHIALPGWYDTHATRSTRGLRSETGSSR